MRHLSFSLTSMCAVIATLFMTLSVQADAMKQIPADIADIRLFASWEQDGKSGIYRGIVTIPKPGKATFTLQWLVFGDDGALAAVEHSMPVPEVSELDGIITDYRNETDAEGLTIFLDLKESANAIEDTYVIYVNGPADYAFEGASN